jgi:uncharacterized protein with HEPN domain
VSRRPAQRIEDIRLCCEKVLRYTSGMSREALAENELVTDAVLRNIEVIGEATKNLPDDVRATMPDIEWKKIAGMRDWLSHVYYRVDSDIVWDVVETKIPELLRAIQGFQDEDQP